MTGIDKNCITAQTTPNAPKTRAAAAVSSFMKSSTSFGRTGTTRPIAIMSSAMVTKMKTSAAGRRPCALTIETMMGS